MLAKSWADETLVWASKSLNPLATGLVLKSLNIKHYSLSLYVGVLSNFNISAFNMIFFSFKILCLFWSHFLHIVA